MSATPPPSANAARQRVHWDAVLDADNVGRERVTARGLLREAQFTRLPENRALWRAVAECDDPLVVDLGGGLGAIAVALVLSTSARVVVADVSGERLRALRSALTELGARHPDLPHRIHPVQTSAESLALRSGAADILWTKSVLIHTELEASMAEITRCLGSEGRAVLCEPTDANPLVRLHRRFLAPKEWREITRYFSPEREQTVLEALGDPETERHHVIGFLAFVWQFALRSVWLLRLSLLVLEPIDRLMMRVWPAWRRRAWFVVMKGRGR
ncbi:class I SAM-dependent methyltransferase [Candidatus Sumerlaeota bacterium]|nr:class I SAM-dependent methyltransferase [Candidatus Sumerlaeota bacterium]